MHQEYLRATYPGADGEPGPFSYKAYLVHMLDKGSWGDHVPLGSQLDVGSKDNGGACFQPARDQDLPLQSPGQL